MGSSEHSRKVFSSIAMNIELESSDQIVFQFTAAAMAAQCEILEPFLNQENDSPVRVPLCNVDSNILTVVQHYCINHVNTIAADTAAAKAVAVDAEAAAAKADAEVADAKAKEAHVKSMGIDYTFLQKELLDVVSEATKAANFYLTAKETKAANFYLTAEMALEMKKTADKAAKLFDFVRKYESILFELMAAADYMVIHSLLDMTSQAIADKMIKGKKPDEIRRAFELPNDLTEREREELEDKMIWMYE